MDAAISARASYWLTIKPTMEMIMTRTALRRPASRVRHTALAVLIGTAAARADVTVERNSWVNGGGAMTIMNMTTRTTTYISRDRSRTDSTANMDSGLMRVFVHGGPKAEIVRLDSDAIYEIDIKKKQYTETSLAARRDQLQQALAQSQQAQASRQQQASGVDESQCEWSPATATVSKTGETLTVAGFQAKRTTITASQTCKNKTHPADQCEFRLTYDQWLASTFPAEKEALVYYRAYAAKMGLDVNSGDFAERAESMFGQYHGIWAAMASKMKDVVGYPMKANFALAVGGLQCASSTQSQSASNSQAGQPPIESVGRAVGAVGGAIGGLFHKKPAVTSPESTASTVPPLANPDGLFGLLSIGSEIVSASQDPVSPQEFEVPAGFKLKR
jgi:hypothetical protein